MADIYLETYGCQMNEYDSELVRSILVKERHVFTKQEDAADVILLNTCAVRENAFNKIYARVGDLKYLRQSRKTRVGVLGCMAQNLKNKLLENRNIDFVVGPDSYRELPSLIGQSLSEKPLQLSATKLSTEETYSDVDPTRESGANAWIAIMRGCDNFCTFCVVPFTRGRERSRSVESIVEEVKNCVSAGSQQITLLGQNVNSYRSGDQDFADLMEAVANVKGVKRVRFTSPHPKDFPEELLRVIAKYPNLCQQIHLPLQAGNSEVLRKMNRGYTREEFLEIANRIRNIIPEVHITTDIIVGFPGETEEQFLETKSVMEEVKFESAFIFKYSPREGTLAKRKFSDDVTEEEKKKRIVMLNQLQKELTDEALQKFIGKEVEVLIEHETTPLSNDQCQGRVDQGVMVVLPQDGSIKVGDLVPVHIHNKTSHVLLGEAISDGT